MEELMEILTVIKEGVEYKNEKNLVEDGIFSSYEIFQCIILIEQRFGIKIPAKDILPNNFKSIDTIWDLIQRCQNE